MSEAKIKKREDRKKPKTGKKIDFGWAFGASNLSNGYDLPDGVYGEILEGFTDRDVVNYTADDLKEFLESKKAWDLYLRTMQELQGNKGFWGYKEKQVAETLKNHYEEFLKLGIKTFFCVQLVGVNQSYFPFKWIIYADTEVISDDYVPEKVYKEGGCSVM